MMMIRISNTMSIPSAIPRGSGPAIRRRTSTPSANSMACKVSIRPAVSSISRKSARNYPLPGIRKAPSPAAGGSGNPWDAPLDPRADSHKNSVMAKRIILAVAICGGGLMAWHLLGGTGEGPSLADARENSQAGSPAASRLKTPARAKAAPRDPTAALLKALRSGSTDDRSLALDVLLPDLMLRDLPAAAAFACALEPHESREPLLLLVADKWASSDPDVAAAFWATHLKDRSEISACISATCRQVARTHPSHAITLAQAHGEDQLTAEIAGLWVTRNRPEAEAWIERLPDAGERERHWSAAVLALAETSPLEAATLAAERIPAGAAQEEAIIAALHQWIRRDPSAAAAWVKDFPEGPLRERALGEFSGGH